MSKEIVVIVGLGEVGRPLMEILSSAYECVGVDVQPLHIDRPCSVLHICYPYQIPNFVDTTVKYIEQYQPQLTIINSTLGPGTTHQVQQRVNTPVVYSPVRGKHAKMVEHMLRYQKFVATADPGAAQAAADHFQGAGFRTATFRTPEVGEFSKLMETSWLAILIGWAQEVERLGAEYGASFEEVNAFIKEVDFLPSDVFPGFIGGHCLMPNIAILRSVVQSKYLDAIVESNEAKKRQLNSEPSKLDVPVSETRVLEGALT